MVANSEPVYSPRENDIFIAYSAEDLLFVKKLDTAIRRLSRDPWIDLEDLPVGIDPNGAEAWNHIQAGVSNADVFVFVVSPHSVISLRNLAELKLAKDYNKRLIPILYEPVAEQDLPEALRDSPPLRVNGGIHLGALADTKINEIARTIVHIDIHDRLLERAAEWERSDYDESLLLRGSDLRSVEQWMMKNAALEPKLLPAQIHFVGASSNIEGRGLTAFQRDASLDVFISYSRRDRQTFVGQFCETLKKHGLNIWVDWENIPVAADWREEIREGILAANNFVFIISPNSIASKNCLEELTIAVQNNKRLIPILWKSCDRAAYEQDPNLRKLRQYQRVEFENKDFDASIEEVKAAINFDLEHVKTHTRILAQAIEWDSQKRKKDYLLTGRRLLRARSWLGQSGEKEPQPTELQREYIHLSRNRQRRQIVVALAIATSFTTVLTGLMLSTLIERKGKIEALVSSLEGNQGLDALISSIKAGHELRNYGFFLSQTSPNLPVRVVTALQQEIYNSRELNRLGGHDKGVYNISFSPDGKLIASASQDGTLVWEADGRFLKIPADLRQKEQDVVGVAFNPAIASNSYTLATATPNGVIKLWKIDVKTLTVTFVKTLKASGTNSYLYLISYSPGGQLLAAASDNGTVRLWDWQGNPLGDLQHPSAVFEISFDPLSQKLAVAQSNGTVTVWTKQPNGKFGQPIALLHSTHPNPEKQGVQTVSFSPDGKTLASGGLDGSIKLWSRNGTLIKQLEGHEGLVYRVVFSPNSQILASASEDGSVRLWRSNGQPWDEGSQSKILRGHAAAVYRVQFRPDGQMLATAGADRTIKLWSADGDPLDSFGGHGDDVLAIEFALAPETGKKTLLASASADGTVRLWKTDSLVLTLPHNYRVFDADFTPDSKVLATGGSKTIRLWNVSDGSALFETPLEQDGDVYSLRFSPHGDINHQDGQLLAGVGQTRKSKGTGFDGTIRLWKLTRAGATQLQTWVAHNGITTSISFNADGQLLASGGEDGWVKLWRIRRTGTGYEARLVFSVKLNGSVSSLSFSDDGQFLATTSNHNDRGTLTLWQLEQERHHYHLKQIDHQRSDNVLNSVDFSPHRQFLAMAGKDKAVYLWRLTPNGKLNDSTLQILRGHADEILRLHFSANAKQPFLATASRDSTIKVWAMDGNLVTTLKRHQGGVSSVSFSSDNKTLASTGYDNRALLWKKSKTFGLDELIQQGCQLVNDYIRSNRVPSEEEVSTVNRETLTEVQSYCKKPR